MRSSLAVAWLTLGLLGCSARAATSPPAPAGPSQSASERALEAQPSAPAPAAPLGAAPEAPVQAPVQAALVSEPGFKHPLVAAHETRGVVLLYHGFDRGPDPLSVSSSRFREQMQWLLDNQVEVIQVSRLVSFLRGEHLLPARVAVVSMDDGMSSVYYKAWPILKQLGVPFSLGISTALVEEKKRYTMNWDQVREMHQSGLVEIASHGHQHRGLANLPEKLVDEELNRSRELLQLRVGVTPSVYFYPLGSMDRRARELVTKSGYAAAFTASGAPIAIGSAHIGEVPRTSIFHADTIHSFSYFFNGFLNTLPEYQQPKPQTLSQSLSAQPPN